MSLRFVVVGSGRSATRYASELFCQLGVPCGHESFFAAQRAEASSFVGDASFGAVPFLAGFDGVVLHQVRHPLAVLRSILATGFFVRPGQYAPYLELIERELPGMASRADPVRKAMHFIVQWNLLCEPFARLRWQVETLDAATLARATELVGAGRSRQACAAALEHVPRDVNRLESRGLSRVPLTWSDIAPCADKSELEELTLRYGYELCPAGSAG
jgi:hypothetical protein